MEQGKIVIRGLRQNNLKNVSLDIPKGKIVVFTGVSGSGKSSLVGEVLNKALLGKLNHARTRPGACRCVEGIDRQSVRLLKMAWFCIQRMDMREKLFPIFLQKILNKTCIKKLI